MKPTAFLLAFALLQLADVASTSYGLSVPGLYEGNPLMAWSIAALGPFWWLPKAGMLVASGLIAWRLRSLWPLGLISALTLVVVVNNLARVI